LKNFTGPDGSWRQPKTNAGENEIENGISRDQGRPATLPAADAAVVGMAVVEVDLFATTVPGSATREETRCVNSWGTTEAVTPVARKTLETTTAESKSSRKCHVTALQHTSRLPLATPPSLFLLHLRTVHQPIPRWF
jgi:hypothetical protein